MQKIRIFICFFLVKVKWGKELYNEVELNTDEEPVVFKAQLFALTGVQPNRQKVMIKGAAIKDESWENVSNKMKNGATLLLMGSKEEDIPKEVTAAERIKFVEDMDENQIKSELKLPAGLTNLGNTCYLNATLQCFKTVPELKKALQDFDGGLGSDDRALASALRDLYRTMDKGQTIPPLVLVQLVHNVFPRFAERGEQGGFQQQDANECWIELMGVLKRHLTMKTPDAKSVIDTYFGLEFEVFIILRLVFMYTDTGCLDNTYCAFYNFRRKLNVLKVKKNPLPSQRSISSSTTVTLTRM